MAEKSPRTGATALARIDEEIRAQGSAARITTVESLLCIRDRDGKVRKFTANAVQRKYEERAGQKNIVLKARQMGITTWVAARFFLDVITQRGLLAVQVAHNGRSAEQIFRIVHRFYQHLPQAWREGYLRTSRANARQLVFPEIDCEYRVESAGDIDAGRGLTIQRLHCSEVGRWGNAEETLASLRAAVTPDGEIVLESTPQGTYGAFYREWCEANDAGYARHFFPWWWEPQYRSDEPAMNLTEEEKKLCTAHGLTNEQIAYRRELKNTHRKLAQQEFAEDADACFLASGDCIFDVEALDDRVRDCAELDDAQALWEFLPPLEGKRYVMGVDAAGGGSEGDFACAQVVDESGQQCAELRARLTPEELARQIEVLAKRYNDAVVAVERNAQGLEVMAHLKESAVEFYVDEKGKNGFDMNKKTRPLVTAALVGWEAEMIRSRRLIREMRSFVRDKTGRVAAAPGEHDDTVMAMGIALYVRERMAGKRKAG